MTTTVYSSITDVPEGLISRTKSIAGRVLGMALAATHSWNDALIDRRIARFVRANGGVITSEMERSLGDVAQGLPPRTRTGELDRAVLAVMLMRS